MFFDNTKQTVIFNCKFFTFLKKNSRKRNGFNIVISELC